ncbi:MAG: NCS2 family permease [Acetobacteraceae bacterium]
MFRLAEHGTTARTEVLAGLTTYLTMAYIVVVNPGILALAGIDPGAAFVATCLAAAIGSAAMGLLANLPLALAPGMGINAYFTFVVVKGMGVSWQVALGAVFLSGLVFLAVSLLRVREWLINGIPLSLKLGTGAGIGFFLGLIGLKEMGLVVGSPATLVSMGNLATPTTELSCLGFLIIAGLSARGVRGAILIGIVAVAAIGVPFGLTEFKGLVSHPPSLAPTLFQLDILGALHLGLATVILTLFLVDLLDNAGTLIATMHRAGLLQRNGTIPRLREALLADSGGAIIGSVLGTSTTTSYIESSAGIQAGGRTGLTALVVAALFLLTLFFAPIATSIPSFATAPALVFVACSMAGALRSIDWDDLTEYLPAAVLALSMPFTFSITTGIGLGFIVYALVKLAAGRPSEVPGAVWLIAALCVAKFGLT